MNNPITSGLVAEFLLNEGTGQSLTDKTGNNTSAVLGSTNSSQSSDPTWASTGLTFDGTNDYCNMGAVSGYPLTSDTTSFTFVVVLSRAANGANHQLFQGRKPSSPNQGWDFFLTSGNRLQFRVSANDGTQQAYTTTASIADSAWRIVSLAYNGTSKVASIGIRSTAQKVTETMTVAKTFTSAGGNLDLGGFGSFSNTNFMNGSIGSVLIYNRPLSLDELNTIYGYLQARMQLRDAVGLGDPVVRNQSSKTWNALLADGVTDFTVVNRPLLLNGDELEIGSTISTEDVSLWKLHTLFKFRRIAPVLVDD